MEGEGCPGEGEGEGVLGGFGGVKIISVVMYDGPYQALTLNSRWGPGQLSAK